MRKILKIEERFYRVLMFLSTTFIGIALFVILFSILRTGLPHLSWEMLSEIPHGGYYFGKSGGIFNAIVGSVYLSLGSSLIAFLVGLPIAMFINIHLIRHTKFVAVIRFLLDLLWGVPSIVYGAFGFTIMVFFGMRTSLMAGIITVSLFILPIIVRAMDEVLRNVPKGLLESAKSLGSTNSEIAYVVYFKQCLPGIITAWLLAFGRAIGDAASILFTTGYTDYVPHALNEPAATLPLAIFFQLSSPIPEVRERAYAASAILIFIVLTVSVVSRILSCKYNKNKINF